MFCQQVKLVHQLWTDQQVNMLFYFLHVVSLRLSLRFQVIRCMQLVDGEMNSKDALLVYLLFVFCESSLGLCSKYPGRSF